MSARQHALKHSHSNTQVIAAPTEAQHFATSSDAGMPPCTLGLVARDQANGKQRSHVDRCPVLERFIFALYAWGRQKLQTSEEYVFLAFHDQGEGSWSRSRYPKALSGESQVSV